MVSACHDGLAWQCLRQPAICWPATAGVSILSEARLPPAWLGKPERLHHCAEDRYLGLTQSLGHIQAGLPGRGAQNKPQSHLKQQQDIWEVLQVCLCQWCVLGRDAPHQSPPAQALEGRPVPSCCGVQWELLNLAADAMRAREARDRPAAEGGMPAWSLCSNFAEHAWQDCCAAKLRNMPGMTAVQQLCGACSKPPCTYQVAVQAGRQ